MPIPWLVVLQSVPWAEVIRNAPKVAEGAKRLWSTVNGKVDIDSKLHSQAAEKNSEDAGNMSNRIEVVEAAVADLHQQMMAASELIRSLADQNAELIRRIELNTRRTNRLILLVAVLSCILIFIIAFKLGN